MTGTGGSGRSAGVGNGGGCMRTGKACVSPTWGGGVSVVGLGGRPVSRGEKVSTTVSLEGCELLRCGDEGGPGAHGRKGGLG